MLKQKTLAVVTTALLCCNLMDGGAAYAGTYQVQNGDSLYSIANSHKITVEELKRVNQLTNEAIYAGNTLYIPDTARQHQVAEGDTLYLLAQRYQCTVSEIKNANGLTGDTIKVGQMLTIPGANSREAAAATSSRSGGLRDYTQEEWDLLAQAVYGEARGESYKGQVAVAAVVLNRVESSEFPNTIEEVIMQRGAFTCVSDGQFYLKPDSTAYLAARDALAGQDPTRGCLYYWNPVTATSQWIWTRSIEMQIGNHVFGN